MRQMVINALVRTFRIPWSAIEIVHSERGYRKIVSIAGATRGALGRASLASRARLPRRLHRRTVRRHLIVVLAGLTLRLNTDAQRACKRLFVGICSRRVPAGLIGCSLP